MSDEIDDGGPAFPNEEVPGVLQMRPGMSLRDWFAGQCMSGLLMKDVHAGDVRPSKLLADASYYVADAMIEARKTKP